jgi:tRNA dimethylallyltransferase
MEEATPIPKARQAPETRLPPVVVVTGPTASGKSSLALHLAEKFDGEIINADSMQVFRFMDIGTAKPSAEERARVPHHLFNIANPDEPYSAGRYAKEAREAAAAIHDRDRPVFLVGGTGLYIRAFLDGLIETGGVVPGLRKRLEEEQASAREEGDPDRLHRRLADLDADAAAKIHPNDIRRTVRALEIQHQSGLPASSVREAHGFRDRPFRVLHLAIDPGREVLNRRIEERAEAMIEAGLLREVRDLREQGYGADLRPMQAIGYRHIQPVVDGADTLANAVEAMKVDTRRFARRQRTWIRPLADVHWHHPDDLAAVVSRVESFLASEESTEESQPSTPPETTPKTTPKKGGQATDSAS